MGADILFWYGRNNNLQSRTLLCLVVNIKQHNRMGKGPFVLLDNSSVIRLIRKLECKM